MNYKSLDGKKQSMLWTIYHTVLAIEIGLLIVIELAELLIYYNQIKGF